MEGKKLLYKTIPPGAKQAIIETDHLPAGIYLLKYFTKNRIVTKTFARL